jgi:hypothetical protein
MDSTGRRLLAAGRYYVLGEGVRAELGRLIGARSEFFCGVCTWEEQAMLFNRHYPKVLSSGAADIPRELRIVVEDGATALGLTGSGLVLLPAFEILDAALQAAPAQISACGGLVVRHVVLQGRIGIALIWPAFQVACRAGEEVLGGVDIHHSDVASFATQISSLLAWGCSGPRLLVRVGVCRKAARAPRGWAAAHRSARAGLQRLAGRAWAGVGKQLSTLAALSREPVSAPGAELERIARRYDLKLGRKTIAALKASLGPGKGRETLYDVVRALAELAAADRPWAWQRRVMFACGAVLRERLGIKARSTPRRARRRGRPRSRAVRSAAAAH